MTFASYASLKLTRFKELHTSGSVHKPATTDALFCDAGADSGAAGAAPDSHEAHVFALLGLHPTLEATQRFIEAADSIAPWMNDADEIWTAVLQPFRHTGEANLLDRGSEGPLFEALATPPPANEPIVVVTSAGWRRTELDFKRIQLFSRGVYEVRTAMTGITGLNSQQSFTFPGGLEYDPITVSIWQDIDAMKSWAYMPGVHFKYLEQHRKHAMADRSSFTRYRILQSSGTWHGEILGHSRNENSVTR